MCVHNDYIQEKNLNENLFRGFITLDNLICEILYLCTYNFFEKLKHKNDF